MIKLGDDIELGEDELKQLSDVALPFLFGEEQEILQAAQYQKRLVIVNRKVDHLAHRKVDHPR